MSKYCGTIPALRNKDFDKILKLLSKNKIDYEFKEGILYLKAKEKRILIQKIGEDFKIKINSATFVEDLETTLIIIKLEVRNYIGKTS